MGRGLLKDHVRDIQRVKGVWCGGVGVLLAGHAGASVLDQGQRLEHHLWDICGTAVLHLALQLHPPVLKPGSDLQRGDTCGNADTSTGERPLRASSYLSFCEAELLCRPHPLTCVQVSVVAEDLFQLVDLLCAKLGAHTALLGLLHFINGETLGGGGLAVIPRGVPTHL